MSSALRDLVSEDRPLEIKYGDLGEFRDGLAQFVAGRVPSFLADRRVEPARCSHLRRWEDDGGKILLTMAGGES